MGKGRRGDGDGIDQRQEFGQFIAAECPDAMLCRQGLGPRLVEIINTDKLHGLSLLVFIGMIAAKNTGAHDAHSQNFSHDNLFCR